MYLQGKRKTIYKMRDYLYGTRKRRKDRGTWLRNNSKGANDSDLEFRFRYGIKIFNPKFIGRWFTQISMIREVIIRRVNGIKAIFIFPK